MRLPHMMSVHEFCETFNPCRAGYAWARTQPDMRAIWFAARPDWRLWIATRGPAMPLHKIQTWMLPQLHGTYDVEPVMRRGDLIGLMLHALSLVRVERYVIRSLARLAGSICDREGDRLRACSAIADFLRDFKPRTSAEEDIPYALKLVRSCVFERDYLPTREAHHVCYQVIHILRPGLGEELVNNDDPSFDPGHPVDELGNWLRDNVNPFPLTDRHPRDQSVREFCQRYCACDRGTAWGLTQPDLHAAWLNARPDWRIWMATREGVLTKDEAVQFILFMLSQFGSHQDILAKIQAYVAGNTELLGELKRHLRAMAVIGGMPVSSDAATFKYILVAFCSDTEVLWSNAVVAVYSRLLGKEYNEDDSCTLALRGNDYISPRAIYHTLSNWLLDNVNPFAKKDSNTKHFSMEEATPCQTT